MIEQTYFLDMIPGESTPPVVHVSQFDVNSRTLTFNLMKGGVAFVPDADMSVTLDGMKPDNHVFSYPMTVNGSSVSIDVLTQMTVVSGHVRCEVSVSNQIGKIGSANFILAVEESPIDSGSISESDIPIFEDLKNQAQQAAASAEQSASDAEGFAADAETAASSVSAILPASAGTTGQVLTKTATGADWETIDATDIETSSGVAIKSVNGNPVTITDALQGYALGMNTALEPIQDLHGYDHPWAGGAGKNLAKPLNNITAIGVTLSTDNLGRTAVSGTATSNGGRLALCSSPFSLSAGTYTISHNGTGDWGDVLVISLNGGAGVAEVRPNIERISFTVAEDAEFVVGISVANGTSYNGTLAPQIELGSTATSYEPYSNICPISGRTQVDVNRTGKNLWNPSDILAGFINSGTGFINDNPNCKICYIPCKPNTTYTVSKTAGKRFTVSYTNELPVVGGTVSGSIENSTGSHITITTGDDAKYLCAWVYLATADTITAEEMLASVQIELGSTATAYEPYAGQSVAVQLGQTVYGGTLNVTTGELSVETANIASYNGETIGEPWWSSMDEYVAGATPTTGAQVVYTLASPTTVSLTPAQIQLLTTTNIISTNADDLSARYYATGQTGNVEGNIAFLLDKTASNETAVNTVSESIAPTETGTATQNYAIGTYLMLNNRLCKVTSAIATGEQIIVGSNVQYTTIADELLAIFSQLNA